MSSNASTFDSSHTNTLPTCVILFNGFPGVGKLTVAKALKTKLEKDNIPHRLLDNHLLIDPVVAIEPLRNHAHYVLRKSFRKLAFDGLRSLNENGLVIICTAALSTSAFPTPYDDIAQFMEYVEMSESRAVPLVVVNLLCDISINSERLCSDGRKGEYLNSKTKLTNVEILEKIRRDTELLTREQIMACGMKGRTFYLELETSALSAEQSTGRIWEFLSNEVPMSGL